jgi:aspartokinase
VTLHSLNMLHSRGFLAEVFGILARHNISVDLITTSEVSVALTLDTTGSTSTGDTLLTQSLLIELSELCRVEVEEDLALVAIIGNKLSQSLRRGQRGVRRARPVQHPHDLLRRVQLQPVLPGAGRSRAGRAETSSEFV